MFEDSLSIANMKGTSAVAVLLSTLVQCVVISLLLLIPLLNYYELPATEFVSFLTAPPPPPPPPPPPVMVKVVPREFDTGALTQPVAIPDQVAVIEEDVAAPSAGIAGVVGGVPGGSIGGAVGGVLGSIISSAPTVAPPPPPPPPGEEEGAAEAHSRRGQRCQGSADPPGASAVPATGPAGAHSGHGKAFGGHIQGRNDPEVGGDVRPSAAGAVRAGRSQAVALPADPIER